MKETLVALLPNDEVAFGEVILTNNETELIVWEVGTVLPQAYFPIVPKEEYNLHLAA